MPENLLLKYIKSILTEIDFISHKQIFMYFRLSAEISTYIPRCVAILTFITKFSVRVQKHFTVNEIAKMSNQLIPRLNDRFVSRPIKIFRDSPEERKTLPTH